MSDAESPFGRRPAVPSEALLAEIDSTAAAIAGSDAAAAGPRWGAMHKLLLRAKVDPQAIMRLVANRDAAGLAGLVRWLRGEEVEVAESEVAASEVAASVGRPAESIDVVTQRSAMRAFRKRLRFARLDAESRLGVGPLSGGKRHEIDAIVPPREYPIAVWEALVAAGRLRREGGGFYALVDEPADD